MSQGELNNFLQRPFISSWTRYECCFLGSELLKLSPEEDVDVKRIFILQGAAGFGRFDAHNALLLGCAARWTVRFLLYRECLRS